MADMNSDIREGFKNRRGNRDAKLARIFAKPEQVTRTNDGIVVAPRGETSLQKAEREAKETRALADNARRMVELG